MSGDHFLKGSPGAWMEVLADNKEGLKPSQYGFTGNMLKLPQLRSPTACLNSLGGKVK